ncbi:MAG: Rne/Rng family ribonuclease [Clostridiales bacterium]|nr:Rne/Rng family ribonuclease [Clostridiales bacterium]
MRKKIIVDIHHDQIRVALLENEDLVELYFEDEENLRIVGNIYRGRIANVLPGMQAAFIDIGLERNAFLYLGDIDTQNSAFEFTYSNKKSGQNFKRSVIESIRPGQEITVQVLKESIGTKGARVTTHLTLPGRYLVLMPNVDYIGISRRIDDSEERDRLKSIAEEIKPDDMGLIVRTAALNRQKEDFIHDLDLLYRLWRHIVEIETTRRAPCILHKDESIVYKTVRDIFTQDIDEFIINDKTQYNRVKELVEIISPGLTNRVNFYDREMPIFEYYNIERKIEKAIQKKVWLKNGGYIVIDSTEALTAIDVNTGKYVGKHNLEDTVFKTNLEAAEEIAHQIRLRDIGGIIIIDFIDMEIEEHNEKVINILRQELAKDRTKTNVVGITGLGLIEMTRKKERNRLSAALLKPCPYCNGTGRVYSENMIIAKIEKELEDFFRLRDVWGAIIEVHPDIEKVWLEDGGKTIEILENTLNRRVFVTTDQNIHLEQVNIKPLHGQAELEGILLAQTSK